MNSNWPRWVYTSISKHFKTLKDEDGLIGDMTIFIEGEDEDRKGDQEGIELRVNGPFVNNPSRAYYILDFEINLLISIAIDEADIYRLQRVIGGFYKIFTNVINCYRYGDGVSDDKSYLGCLVIRSDRGDEIVVTNFGQVSPDIRIMQSTVNAIYKIELTT